MLNRQQQFIVDSAVDWFNNSSSTLFQFCGPAGTGKSFVLNEILNRLHLYRDEILPMAYTGQACSVMRKKGLPDACTCHSGLFTPVEQVERDSSGRIRMNKTFNVPLVKWVFVPKDFTNSKIRLIILDEAWMIPKRFKKFIDDTGIKVIATGDQAQLPPVGDDPGYLLEDCYQLTEIMRQAEDSPIVYLATRARQGLPIQPGMYGNDVLVIFDDELNDSIIARASVVLCGKNITRESINQKVREDILHFNTDFPNFGERIICRKNNWDLNVEGIPLVNGLTGTVVNPPSIGTFNGEVMTLDFLPDLLSTPFVGLKVNYNYINASYEQKKDLSMNPYLVGERFEYAYASTVHLSQGSEYPCGVYIEEYLRGDMQNALNYTAITRFKNQMVYVKIRPKYWSLNTNYLS